MIAGFSAINGHINGQCRVVGSGSGGLLAAPQVASQAPRKPGMTPDLCLHLQSQGHFNGHPQCVCATGGGLTHYVKHTPPLLLPPPPPPQPLSAQTLPLPQCMPVPAGAVPKLGQGGFKKVCRTEEASPCPFPGLPAGVLQMRVKEGSKIRNLMGFAMARMQGPPSGTGSSASTGSAGSVSTGLRQVVFSGSGRAVTKTITCAEIMKRKLGGLHQLTKLCYKSVREVWESQEPGGGGSGGDSSNNNNGAASSSEMTVHRTVPSISILLSKDPLDPREPGYQPPQTLGVLWGEREQEQGGGSPQTTTKRAMLEPLLQPGQPSAKRLCVGTGGQGTLGYPADG